MESTSTPGQIHVSESTWQLLKEVDQWRATGGVEVKGKGIMNTYFWVPEDPQLQPGRDEGEEDEWVMPSIRGGQISSSAGKV